MHAPTALIALLTASARLLSEANTIPSKNSCPNIDLDPSGASLSHDSSWKLSAVRSLQRVLGHALHVALHCVDFREEQPQDPVSVTPRQVGQLHVFPTRGVERQSRVGDACTPTPTTGRRRRWRRQESTPARCWADFGERHAAAAAGPKRSLSVRTAARSRWITLLRSSEGVVVVKSTARAAGS